MLSFFSPPQFFSPPFPQALPGHTKGFFSPFSFLSRGSSAGAEGSRACATHPPPSPGAGKPPHRSWGASQGPSIQDCSLPSLWICQALFRGTFITEGHGPSPRLSNEKAFESCCSLSPSSLEPHTDPLHTSSRRSLKTFLLLGMDKKKAMLISKAFHNEQDAAASACRSTLVTEAGGARGTPAGRGHHPQDEVLRG